MYVARVLLNGILIVGEIAACAGIAWAALHHPWLFAGVTAGAAFAVGAGLEIARLRNEVRFYFGRETLSAGGLFLPVVGLMEALFKGLLAAVAAILTFAGTDHSRLFFIAIAFGVTIYAGVAMLRALSIGLGASPARWGFFRLGAPLGLLFSALIAVMAAYQVIPPTSVGQIGWSIVWDMPKIPTVEQVSELLFQIKQAFDGFVVTILSTVMAERWARIVAVLISVNVLAGFVAAFYASLIAGVVNAVERPAEK
ncbi:MAG: hypothetical protein NW216_14230 [Hyphomicrobium sp.]|nr:hypothetical protein [Hyphomicrobium sp.]